MIKGERWISYGTDKVLFLIEIVGMKYEYSSIYVKIIKILDLGIGDADFYSKIYEEKLITFSTIRFEDSFKEGWGDLRFKILSNQSAPEPLDNA